MSVKKNQAEASDWMRGPGDHYEVQGAVEVFDLPPLSPRDLYELAERKLSEIDAYVVGKAVDEASFEEARHKALVLMWAAASRGVLEACNSIGKHILAEVTATARSGMQKELFEQIAERWLVIGGGDVIVPKRAVRIPLRRQNSDSELLSVCLDFDEKASEPDVDGEVVVPAVGDSLAGEGAQIAKRFASIVGKALPSLRSDIPTAGTIRDAIVADWPWAEKVAIHLEGVLQIQRSVGLKKPLMPPMLFVGPPGSGKTALAERIASIFGVPSLVVPAGGANDSAGLGAVSRGWSGARPCGPVMAALQFNCCDPAIIVDELDKTQAPGAKNGSASGILLGMMGNPDRFQDTCLLENVNLSKMMFMATANHLETIPEALLDRFTLFHIPRPSAKHFYVVLANAKRRYAESLGVPAELLPSLDADECELLLRQFSRTDASLRDFARAYRHVLSQAVGRTEEEELIQTRLLN